MKTPGIEYIGMCPVCDAGPTNIERILNSSVHVHGNELFYTVGLCHACGLIFSPERSSCEGLYTAALDPEKDHGRQHSATQPLNHDFIRGFTTKRQQAAEIEKLFPGRGGVYGEIGASDGSLFRLVQEHIQETDKIISSVLIESSGAATACEKIENCHVYSTPWQDVDLTSESPFDVFVLSHCLEHFSDPRHLLTTLYNCIGKNGYLFVEVPDASRYDYSISYPLGYFHILHFNLINIAWFIDSCGFIIVDIIQRELSPGIRVIAQKKGETQKDSPPFLGYQWAHGIIKQWESRRCLHFKRLRRQVGNELKVPLLIFGAGTHTTALLDEFPSWLLSSQCDFVDSCEHGTYLHGRKVLHPCDVDWKKYGHVLISSYAFQEEMVAEAIARGCTKEVIITLYDMVFAY